MRAAHLQTAQGMAAAAERIGEELARVKGKIASSATEAGDDLAAELRQLQSDLSDIKATIADFGQKSGAQAGDAASRIGAAASEAAGDFAKHAKQDAESVIGDLEAFARKNPGYVVGGALGIGVLLGLMLRRH